ncbi:DeSI-like protein [Symbiodinium microadriaticum]|uniref:DeSI-like protein n=1 Tax=Symbiodinium microadriaticum TaxID=2951 RepID=A0A1Q9EW12_SYMMI|nr:DeSI-like protein [Symbiodinium microadriaticum]
MVRGARKFLALGVAAAVVYSIKEQLNFVPGPRHAAPVSGSRPLAAASGSSTLDIGRADEVNDACQAFQVVAGADMHLGSQVVAWVGEEDARAVAGADMHLGSQVADQFDEEEALLVAPAAPAATVRFLSLLSIEAGLDNVSSEQTILIHEATANFFRQLGLQEYIGIIDNIFDFQEEEQLLDLGVPMPHVAEAKHNAFDGNALAAILRLAMDAGQQDILVTLIDVVMGEVAARQNLRTGTSFDVCIFMHKIGLEQYIDALLAARYDTMEDLCQIEEQDLIEMQFQPEHVQKMMRCTRDASIVSAAAEVQKDYKPVFLNIYDCSKGKQVRGLNKALPQCIGGIFHAGVEVNGLEWEFNAVDRRTCAGVGCTLPGSNAQHRYRQTVHLGNTNLTPVTALETGCQEEIADVISQLVDEYPGDRYDLLSCNCCHFADDFSRLGTGGIPGTFALELGEPAGHALRTVSFTVANCAPGWIASEGLKIEVHGRYFGTGGVPDVMYEVESFLLCAEPHLLVTIHDRQAKQLQLGSTSTARYAVRMAKCRVRIAALKNLRFVTFVMEGYVRGAPKFEEETDRNFYAVFHYDGNDYQWKWNSDTCFWYFFDFDTRRWVKQEGKDVKGKQVCLTQEQRWIQANGKKGKGKNKGKQEEEENYSKYSPEYDYVEASDTAAAEAAKKGLRWLLRGQRQWKFYAPECIQSFKTVLATLCLSDDRAIATAAECTAGKADRMNAA